MRWFKHFSDASNDEFISDMEDEFGLIGYARWWKMLEVIAGQMDETNKHSAAYPEKKWCRLLQCKPKVLTAFLECTNNAGKTKIKQNGNIIEIFCPKLLELRDNHSRNLQAKSKKVESDLPIEVEVEVEEEKEDIYRDELIKKLQRAFGAKFNSLDFQNLPTIMAFSEKQIDEGLKKSKGKNPNYLITVLQNMPEEKEPKKFLTA
jgi:hypothetical protein